MRTDYNNNIVSNVIRLLFHQTVARYIGLKPCFNLELRKYIDKVIIIKTAVLFMYVLFTTIEVDK